MKIENWNKSISSWKILMIEDAGKKSGMPKDDIEYILRNQHILDQVIEQIDALLKAGRKRYAMRTIIEWLRHNSSLSCDDNTFKISNRLPPRLSRITMALFPEELDGFFEVRG